MERLTKFDYENYRALKPKQDVVDKLGELEDVLEKWHIEDLDKFLEEQIAKERELNDILWEMEQELAELKQSQNEKAIKVLEMMIEEIRSLNMPNKPELYNNDMFVTGFESHYLGVERIIDNQIKSLKGEE